MNILKNKNVKMLEMLDSKIVKCERCSLHSGGHVKPYWTPNSQFGIIGEAPGKDEVKNGIPFVGKSGKHLWEILEEFHFHKDQFLIINSANCRPTDGRKNLKPKKEHLQVCRDWLKLYLRIIKPHRVLLLGNYATDTILNEGSGIMSTNATDTYSEEFGCHIVRSVHPSMCIYNGKKGEEMLRRSINLFANII